MGAAPASLLPELEEVVQHGSAEKRAETLRRITGLFLDGAPAFRDEHVAVFDDVIGYLIEEIEAKALAELSRKLAPVTNAPVKVVTRLAGSDDIDVAEPLLKQAHLPDPELIRIAETKGQAHLLALSARGAVSEALADVIVTRGDRDVSRSLATNAAVRQMHKDGKLTEAKNDSNTKTSKNEETIAALATLCAVPVEIVDRLM